MGKIWAVVRASPSPTHFCAQLEVLQMPVAAAWQNMDAWGAVLKTPIFKKTTPRGFEPLRAEPNGFRVHLLNRSDTVSVVIHSSLFAVSACWGRLFVVRCLMLHTPCWQTRCVQGRGRRGDAIGGATGHKQTKAIASGCSVGAWHKHSKAVREVMDAHARMMWEMGRWKCCALGQRT